MKILIVSQYFWPENFRINELVSALNKRGVEIDVLTGKPNYPAGVVFKGYSAWGCMKETQEGVSILRVPIVPRGSGLIRLALNYLSFVLAGVSYGTWLLRGRRYDAIFVFGVSPIFQAIPAILFGHLKNAPVLVWVQDLWPESLIATGHVNNRSLQIAVEYAVKWVYQKTDLLLVQSKAFIPKVKALAGERPIIYFPNFFIENISDVPDGPIACQGLDCAFPVVFAGNIGSAQSVEVILEAASLTRDVDGLKYVMIGDGSRRKWMQQQAAIKGLENIVFSGSFPVKEMPRLMGRAAALLVTLADSEILCLTVPSKVQAYLATGRPVVACMSGAGADVIIDAAAGIVVPAGDGVALARAVRELHALPFTERELMGNNGRRFYEQNFSQDKLVDQLMKHLALAVDDFRRR